MKYLILCLGIILGCTNYSYLKAQRPQLSIPVVKNKENLQFEHLTVNDGFYGNAIFCLLQARNGIMWFGTWYGLYKYDGKKLTPIDQGHFYNEYLGKTIFHLLEDSQSKIWAITKKGLIIWDPVYEEEYTLDKIGMSQQDALHIKTFCQDDRGNIWLAGNKALFKYVLSSNTLYNYSSEIANKKLGINQLYKDLDGQLWLATNQGVLKLNTNDEYEDADTNNIATCTVTEYPLFNELKHINVMRMYQDTRHNYWISSINDVYTVNKSLNGEYNCKQLQLNVLDKEAHAFQNLEYRVFAQRENTLYIGTSKGILSYSFETHKASLINAERTNNKSINNNSIYDMLVDREGSLWVGTFNGGVNFSSLQHSNFTYKESVNDFMSGTVIKSIAEDANKNIWFGLDETGISCWNRQTDKVENFNQTTIGHFKPSADNVQCVFAHQNKLCVGTYGGGMDIMDLKTKKVINYNEKNTFPDTISPHVYTFASKDEETLWVGDIQALYTLNIHTGETHRVKSFRHMIKNIVTDNQGNMWIWDNDGLSLYKTAQDEWIHYSSEKDSLSRYEISTLAVTNGSVYLGTHKNGLWMFDKAEERYHCITNQMQKDVLIQRIIEDNNVLWITTNKGLYMYNKITQAITHYTNKNGLKSNFFCPNSGIKTSDGLIILGGVFGMNTFYTSQLRKVKVKPQVLITGFYIFNKPVNVHSENSPLEVGINYTSKLTLHEKMHSLAFQLSSSSYCEKEENRYEYRLEPFDKSWESFQESKDIVHYNNLSAGEYKLHVRTINGEGIYSDEKVIDITILPFWWKSTLLIILYVLLGIGVVYWFVYTYIKHKKEEFKRFQFEKEQEIYQSKKEFFTCIIHEIRTPLSLILGPLSTIMSRKESFPTLIPDLKIMERNGQRLLNLVNQLMDFRKIDEKSYIVHPQNIEVKSVIKGISQDFHVFKTSQQVMLKEELPEQEECMAYFDREALVKILTNLLSNAYKFTKDYVMIRMNLSKDEKNWEISVADNGIGISSGNQKLIFKSFYQVSKSLPSDYIGTGIGLYVVHQLLELQGGTISVDSKVNEGTVFTISIPKGNQSALPPTEKYTKIFNEKTLSQKKRILVVEDNDDMRNYITSIFTDIYIVDQCTNGEEALEYIAKEAYDLIITDLMMPIVDGLTLCKILKSQVQTSHILIVILTARTDEQTEIDVLKANADAFIKKPFSPEVLKAQISSILSNRKQLYIKFLKNPETTFDVLYRKNDDKEFIQQIDNYIAAHLSDPELEVNELAEESGMGRSMFFKKMKLITGLTPNDYIRTYRLKKAVLLLQNGESRINEVCYKVGFSSPSYFTKRFTMQFGCSPSDFLKEQADTSDNEPE